MLIPSNAAESGAILADEDRILKAVSPFGPDKLVGITTEGPGIVESLTGRRADPSALFRRAVEGLSGRRLRHVVGLRGELLTTPRWLLRHFAEMAEDRLARRRAKEVAK